MYPDGGVVLEGVGFVGIECPSVGRSGVEERDERLKGV